MVYNNEMQCETKNSCIYEIIIIIVEMIVFAIALKEHKKSKAIVFALTANFFSMIFGAIIISSLPV